MDQLMGYFSPKSVTTVTVRGPLKFLQRLLTCDVALLGISKTVRTPILNATGGMMGAATVVRVDETCFKLFLTDENADALQAWARQVSAAFEVELTVEVQSMLEYVGNLDGKDPAKGEAIVEADRVYLHRGPVKALVASEAVVAGLREELIQVRAKEIDPSVREALRILAKDAAAGLEYDETTSPLEAGFESMLDFKDPGRVFIGRALTEARATAGGYEKLQLVAFSRDFEPTTLTEVPLVIVGELGYPLSSIARVPDMRITAGLVRLPASVKVGDQLEALVKTEPACGVKAVLVVDAQA